jgi:hypothetical protein
LEVLDKNVDEDELGRLEQVSDDERAALHRLDEDEQRDLVVCGWLWDWLDFLDNRDAESLTSTSTTAPNSSHGGASLSPRSNRSCTSSHYSKMREPSLTGGRVLKGGA